MFKEKYLPVLQKTVFPGIQGGPLMHVIAAKAVAFKEALSDDFKSYQKQIVKNAKALSDLLKEKGYRIVSGGTDNHLMLLDLKTSKDMTGKEAEKVLDFSGITVNKNTIPYDTEKPFITSGIRIGTPSITTRGMKEQDMKDIADFIDLALTNKGDEKKLLEISKSVRNLLTNKFPLYN